MINLGLNINNIRSPGISSGYYAQGVYFDGGTKITSLGNISSIDNGRALFSVFVYPTQIDAWRTVWALDPEVTYLASFGIGSAVGNWMFSFGDVSGPIYFSNETAASEGGPSPVLNQWTHVIGVVDFRNFGPPRNGTGTGQSIGYYNGLRAGPDYVPPATNASGGPFDGTSTVTFDGLPLWIGQDSFTGDEWIGGVCDLRIFTGISNVLDESGDILEEIKNLFRDPITGKPISPEIATNYFGTQGLVFMSANIDDPESFVNNRGTGGSFELTGNLIISNTSPSD